MKIQSPFVRAASACLGVIVVCAGSALAMKIDLPPETSRLKEAPGVELANAQCVTCHSADYVITQPRNKPLAFWRAEVDKMKNVYGAPIPADAAAPIAEYLTRNYGSGM